MTVREWIADAARRLTEQHVDSPRLDAELLAAGAFGVDRVWTMAHADDPIAESAHTRLSELLRRRLEHEPLAYILGRREFYGRTFRVGTGVLIPRQETELLVEAALDRLPKGASVIDVGTGSGCIAITLKLERPDLRVTACDISPRALEIASSNAESLGAEIELVKSDLLLALGDRKWDGIVSNPPYVETTAELAPEVKDHEPELALFAGVDGLSICRRLASEASSNLADSGFLAVEIGMGQATALDSLFGASGWRIEAALDDLAGITRVLVFRRSGD